MNRLGHSIAVGAALLVATATAQAQIRQGTRVGTNSPIGTTGGVYPGASVPAGMCRIWIDGLPAGRQPAPTDCTTAQRNVPANGRVIYGSRTQPNYPNGSYPSGTVRNGSYDPRLDPRSSQYDPRLDPRSAQYDPRYDPYRTGTSTRRNDAQWERAQRARESEQWKAERRAQKEREKQWKKANRGNRGNGNQNGNDHDDDDNHGHGH